jgi:hypothetical protein
MGWSLSWAALKGGNLQTACAALGLRATGKREETAESRPTWITFTTRLPSLPRSLRASGMIRTHLDGSVKCLRFLSARACSENFSAASDGAAQVPRKLAGLLVGVLSLSFSLFSLNSESSGPQEESVSNKAGETLYQQRCAAGHEGGVPRAPNREALKQMSAENVRFALLGESMILQGSGLTPAQIDAVNQFLTVSYFVRHVGKGGSGARMDGSLGTWTT